MKKRKVPMRTCVGCRKVRPKRELVRFVRTSEGAIILDPSGKVSGRGGYICSDFNCFIEAKKRQRLARALEVAPGEIPWEELEKNLTSLIKEENPSTGSGRRVNAKS